MRLHPAIVAVGVVERRDRRRSRRAVLVAVPILSALVILAEELWVRPRERVAMSRSARMP